MTAREQRNICVFGASNDGLKPQYVAAARELGNIMARRGWGCVNGAGNDGMMRAVTDGVLEAGGRVTGVIPQFMIDNGWAHDRLTTTVATASMHERKQEMARLSQAVIALPGGCGTLEELLEALTWRQLNIMPRPIVVLNTLGYYNALIAMIEHAIDEGFMKDSHRNLWRVVDTPQQAVDAVEQMLGEGIAEAESKYSTH